MAVLTDSSGGCEAWGGDGVINIRNAETGPSLMEIAHAIMVAGKTS